MTRRPCRAVAHWPVHAEALGQGREAGLQRSKIDREIGRGEYDAHKKAASFDIVEILTPEAAGRIPSRGIASLTKRPKDAEQH